MKTPHTVFAAALLGALAITGQAAAKKTESYTVAGFFGRQKPSAELVAKAATELGQKMAGMVQTTDPTEADHRVEILFTGDSYKIFVDALPLVPNELDKHPWEPRFVFQGDSFERAESARREQQQKGR